MGAAWTGTWYYLIVPDGSYCVPQGFFEIASRSTLNFILFGLHGHPSGGHTVDVQDALLTRGAAWTGTQYCPIVREDRIACHKVS